MSGQRKYAGTKRQRHAQAQREYRLRKAVEAGSAENYQLDENASAIQALTLSLLHVQHVALSSEREAEFQRKVRAIREGKTK